VALFAMGLVSSPAHGADSFAGTWTVHPSSERPDGIAPSPWAHGGSLKITTTTENTAREIGAGSDYESRCGKGATAWYIVEWDWSGGGQAGGCTGSPTTQDALYAFAGFGAVQMNLNPAHDGSLVGYWTDNPGFRPGYKLTATPASGGCSRGLRACTKPDDCGATSRAVQNEVRVTCVSGESDCQFHKGGSAAGAWLPLEKNQILKQGDEISCDPDGKALLAFADNSTFTVSNTTQLKIASFFTDGGVVRTEILLKMGEVAAQVNHAEATKSDFKIKTPTFVCSVRGTKFSVFYDPGGGASVESTTEGVVEVDPVKPGLPTMNVGAGKEVEVTRTSMSKVAPIGKSDLRGGVSRLTARDLVLKKIAVKRCRLVTPRTNAFAVKPSGARWLVSVKTIGGKVKGTSTWIVKGMRVTPKNARAKKIARGCR
jgi:hypothetical protein